MKNYITEEIENLTDKELDNLIDSLNQIKINREKKKREKLIDEFEKAWENLRNAGVDICYYDENGDDFYLYINNFDYR